MKKPRDRNDQERPRKQSRICAEKVKYDSLDVANINAIHTGLNVYECPVCKGYHLTKQNRKEMPSPEVIYKAGVPKRVYEEPTPLTKTEDIQFALTQVLSHFIIEEEIPKPKKDRGTVVGLPKNYIPLTKLGNTIQSKLRSEEKRGTISPFIKVLSNNITDRIKPGNEWYLAVKREDVEKIKNIKKDNVLSYLPEDYELISNFSLRLQALILKEKNEDLIKVKIHGVTKGRDGDYAIHTKILKEIL